MTATALSCDHGSVAKHTSIHEHGRRRKTIRRSLVFLSALLAFAVRASTGTPSFLLPIAESFSPALPVSKCSSAAVIGNAGEVSSFETRSFCARRSAAATEAPGLSSSCLFLTAQNYDRCLSRPTTARGSKNYNDSSSCRLDAVAVSTESPTRSAATHTSSRQQFALLASSQQLLQQWAHVMPVTVPITSNQWRKRNKFHRHRQWQRHDEYLSTVLPDHAHPPTVAWAQRYTSVDRLRAAFGSNQNAFWGDLDAVATRRLYKTLLPTALLGLVQAGVHKPEHLAPLAYHARVAAKLYARERSKVPVRIFANLFDGWRQFVRTGRFRCRGMTYEQIWEKYRQAVLEVDGGDDSSDLTTRVCLKILERSCASNEKVDRWVLPDTATASISSLASASFSSNSNSSCASPDLARITAALEDDVRQILSCAK